MLKKHRKLIVWSFRVLFVVIIFFFILSLWFSAAVMSASGNTEPVVFTVYGDDSYRDLALRLKNDGLIDDSLAFSLLALWTDPGGRPRQGDYAIGVKTPAAVIFKRIKTGNFSGS